MRGHCSGTPMSTKPRQSTAARRTSSDTSATAKCSSFCTAALLAVPRYASPITYMPPKLQPTRRSHVSISKLRFVVGRAAVRQPDHVHAAEAARNDDA